MFFIKISVAPCYLQGLKALDELRRLKLPDGATLCVGPHTARTCPVPEGFARQWFSAEALTSGECVTIDQLGPDDVEHNSHGVELSKQITPSRLMELFVVCKFKRLTDELEHVKAMLNELTPEPEPEE